MTEILFYHLTQSTLNETLPSLVERSLARDWKVSLQFTTIEACDAMDSYLWTYKPSSFLPHGSEKDNNRDLQPVYLTTGSENPNQANVRFLLEGAICDTIEDYQRIVIMFDGNNQKTLEKIRNMWKLYKSQNHQITYWSQTQDGRWEKKA